MTSKAWVIMAHLIIEGDEGIAVENELMPLVLCCDCKHFDGEGCCMKIGMIIKDKGRWFCADGEKE